MPAFLGTDPAPRSSAATPLDAPLRGLVEAALKPRARLLDLPPALEQRYEEASWRGRSRGIRNWMLVLSVLCLFWLVIDWMVMPDQMIRSVITRALIMPAIYLGAAALVSRRRSALVQAIAVGVPTLAFALINGYMGELVGGVHAERYNTTALFASFAAIMVLAVQFRYAVVQAVLAILIFEFFVVGEIGAIADKIELVMFYPVSILAALAARRRFERMHRRNFLLLLRDELRVGELAATNNQLTALSNTDALTGVFNRRYFDQAFAAAWNSAVTRGEWIAVVMVDVDHFKMFNDAAGHAEGDRCLQMVAQAIATHLRGGDLVARYGGEEFIALLPQGSLQEALAVGERVRAAVEGLNLVNPGHPKRKLVTVSVGVAAIQAGTADVAASRMLRAADTALYAAKATGRNYVCGASGADEHLLAPVAASAAGAADGADTPLAPAMPEPDAVASRLA